MWASKPTTSTSLGDVIVDLLECVSFENLKFSSGLGENAFDKLSPAPSRGISVYSLVADSSTKWTNSSVIRYTGQFFGVTSTMRLRFSRISNIPRRFP